MRELTSLLVVMALAARAANAEGLFCFEPVAMVFIPVVGLGLLLLSRFLPEGRRTRFIWDGWLVLGTSAALYSVAADYLLNAKGIFFLSWTTLGGMLVLLKLRRRTSAGWNLTLNTLLFFLIFLPLADWWRSPAEATSSTCSS